MDTKVRRTYLLAIVALRHLGQVHVIDGLHSRPHRQEHLGGPLVQHALLKLFVRFVFQLLVAGLLCVITMRMDMVCENTALYG